MDVLIFKTEILTRRVKYESCAVDIAAVPTEPTRGREMTAAVSDLDVAMSVFAILGSYVFRKTPFRNLELRSEHESHTAEPRVSFGCLTKKKCTHFERWRVFWRVSQTAKLCDERGLISTPYSHPSSRLRLSSSSDPPGAVSRDDAKICGVPVLNVHNSAFPPDRTRIRTLSDRTRRRATV